MESYKAVPHSTDLGLVSSIVAFQISFPSHVKLFINNQMPDKILYQF